MADQVELKKPFWSWAHSEADGIPSFARVWTAIITAFVLGWDTAYLITAWRWNAYHLAPGQAPISFLPDPLILAAQAAFITVLYGVNKFSPNK